MAKKILIKNATIINEEKKFISDLLIVDTIIFSILYIFVSRLYETFFFYYYIYNLYTQKK